MNYKVLTPHEFSGSIHGDYGYEINGEKSKVGYVSKMGAKLAMWRKVDKIENVKISTIMLGE